MSSSPKVRQVQQADLGAAPDLLVTRFPSTRKYRTKDLAWRRGAYILFRGARLAYRRLAADFFGCAGAGDRLLLGRRSLAAMRDAGPPLLSLAP
jgi:hypothetical protein